MNDRVTTALIDAFPNHSVDRILDTGPSWNGGNETLGVVFADGSRAFCKLATDGDRNRIAREHAVLRYVADELSLCVPRVLAAAPDATTPYLVTAPASGEELLGVWERSTDADRRALLRGIGATLASLHAERFGSAGEISGTASPSDGDSVRLAIDPAPWPDVLRSTIDRTRKIGTSERLADHYAAVIDCVEANRGRLSGAPAALLHGDITKPNLFVVDADRSAESESGRDPDGIIAIDWELAHVGDPARDLVRAEDQLLNGFDSTGPERFSAALYGGYRERAGGLPPGFVDRAPIYRAVRILGRSGFVDQWATYLDEPIDDLVARADAELHARLESV